MKTASMLILVLAVTFLLAGCSRYGMGPHYGNSSYNNSHNGSGYMQQGTMMAPGRYMR